jgi:predicted phosphoribosyltransferase
MRFHDRTDGGRQLAARLTAYAGRSDVTVLALPRGGVPVAREVATRLGAPLDIFLVRKLGVPGHPEFAMGALAEGGVEVLSEDVIRDLGVPRALVQQVAVRERLELERRDVLYRGGRKAHDVRGGTVILVDDGLATGSTMQAAVQALRQRGPASIVVAAPVGARETCERSVVWPTGSCVSRRPSHSVPLASGTRSSHKPRTKRSNICSVRHVSRLGVVQRRPTRRTWCVRRRTS